MSRTDPGGPAADHAGRLRAAVQTLAPGYFALVMATGIVSVAMQGARANGLSVVLLWLTVLGYGVLVVLYTWRLTTFPAAVLTDVRDPAKVFGYFTFVAATNVLGTRIAADRYVVAGLVLLAVGGLAWLVLGYVIPWITLVGRARRPLLRYANGTWFISAVAAQSVAVLAATLEPAVRDGRRELALLAVFCWSVGMFLYSATGLFVMARLLSWPVEPADVTPPYWVAMGATAITVVAGARIVDMADAPAVTVTRGLAAGVSVVFWAFGTWLIPALVGVGWWRHVLRRVPLRYEAALWSVVFPLGMYGVAGRLLGDADHLALVHDIGADESWVALAAWTIVFVAMIGHLARTVVGR